MKSIFYLLLCFCLCFYAIAGKSYGHIKHEARTEVHNKSKSLTKEHNDVEKIEIFQVENEKNSSDILIQTAAATDKEFPVQEHEDRSENSLPEMEDSVSKSADGDVVAAEKERESHKKLNHHSREQEQQQQQKQQQQQQPIEEEEKDQQQQQQQQQQQPMEEEEEEKEQQQQREEKEIEREEEEEGTKDEQQQKEQYEQEEEKQTQEEEEEEDESENEEEDEEEEQQQQQDPEQLEQEEQKEQYDEQEEKQQKVQQQQTEEKQEETEEQINDVVHKSSSQHEEKISEDNILPPMEKEKGQGLPKEKRHELPKEMGQELPMEKEQEQPLTFTRNIKTLTAADNPSKAKTKEDQPEIHAENISAVSNKRIEQHVDTKDTKSNQSDLKSKNDTENNTEVNAKNVDKNTGVAPHQSDVEINLTKINEQKVEIQSSNAKPKSDEHQVNKHRHSKKKIIKDHAQKVSYHPLAKAKHAFNKESKSKEVKNTPTVEHLIDTSKTNQDLNNSSKNIQEKGKTDYEHSKVKFTKTDLLEAIKEHEKENKNSKAPENVDGTVVTSDTRAKPKIKVDVKNLEGESPPNMITKTNKDQGPEIIKDLLKVKMKTEKTSDHNQNVKHEMIKKEKTPTQNEQEDKTVKKLRIELETEENKLIDTKKQHETIAASQKTHSKKKYSNAIIAVCVTLIASTVLLTIVGIYYRKISIEGRRYYGHTLVNTEEDINLYTRTNYNSDVDRYASWNS